MGILNVTPDSFFAESRVTAGQGLLDRASAMLRAGADALDIGACSTRPGSVPVSAEEEMARLDMALPLLAKSLPDALLSVDTFRPEIADRCASVYNVGIINDVSGGCDDMYKVAADRGTAYVLTYSQPVAGSDVLAEMDEFFAARLSRLQHFGVEKVILDPGFGFGKTLEQNYAVLAGMGRLQRFGLPVLAGLSRKSMACKPLGISPEEALNATVALNMLALQGGASWLRVHDVAEAVQTSKLYGLYSDAKEIFLNKSGSQTEN